MRFNINEALRVQLTDYGRKIHREEHERLARQFPQVPKYEPPKEDADGWSEWQMWILMNTFGPALSLGGPEPFETEIDLPEPKTDEPINITARTPAEPERAKGDGDGTRRSLR